MVSSYAGVSVFMIRLKKSILRTDRTYKQCSRNFLFCFVLEKSTPESERLRLGTVRPIGIRLKQQKPSYTRGLYKIHVRFDLNLQWLLFSFRSSGNILDHPVVTGEPGFL